MDFHLMGEACKQIECYFDNLGISYHLKDNSATLTDYFNLKHKMIQSKPGREIFKANNFSKKARELNLESVLCEIESKIKKGEDINPYLSKSVLKPEDHDFLLNDWKFHHLHLLGTKDFPNDYFYSRADHLLFIHVTDDKVYFIDIASHNDKLVFAHKDFIRIVRDNWNDLHQKFLFGDGQMQLQHNMTEEEIALLRKKHGKKGEKKYVGLLFATQVDNLTYLPGVGSASSGHSNEAMRNKDAFHRRLWASQKYLNENEELVKQHIQNNMGLQLSKLEFSVKLIENVFQVYEKQSGFIF
jgi:hypothetical protein